jgi:hypothetical protein
MEKAWKILLNLLKKKKLASVTRWEIALQTVSEMFNLKIRWKIKYNVLVLEVDNPVLRNHIFLKKKEVLQKVNDKLVSLWFWKILDIKLL